MDYLQAWDKYKDLTYDQLPDAVIKVAKILGGALRSLPQLGVEALCVFLLVR